MRGKTVIFGMVIILAIFIGTSWSEMSVPVSPGGGTEVTGQSCPTFSWSAAVDAAAYRLEVYEQPTEQPFAREDIAAIAVPVIAKEISAPALSWTPSTGECLARGMHYVWYVHGVDAQGQGQWSMGSSFQVEASALSVEQQDAVKEVVKGYLEGDSANGGATEGGTAGGAAEVKTFSGITPMGLEGPTNTFYGTSAGSGITSGTDDTFVGAYAGAANTTGYENSFFGRGAGGANTEGYYNSFVGAYAGNKNTTGDYNSFVGAHAGNKNTAGNANSFVGAGAGSANTTGYSNSFFGRHAGVANTTGYSNSFFGRDAGATNTTGNYNVFLGYEAGYSETNSNKLYIDNCYTGGNCTQPLIYGEFDNRVVRIDGSLTIVTVATPSDIRYKKEIHPLESPLEKVLELRGVTYEWDKDKVNGAGYKSGKQIGLIAQEVEKVLPEIVQTDSKGYKTLSYDKLGPVLIEAVKEQQKEIREKDARIERLEKALEDQQQAIASLMERLVSLENPSKTLALK